MGASRSDAEKPMAISGGRAVTVLLTEEHLRKIIEYDLLKEDEISDLNLSRVVKKSLDAALGLPDLPWHDWDEWGKGAYVTAASTSETRDDRHARNSDNGSRADDLLSGYASMLTTVFSKQRQPCGERGHQA
jgi:hypothetical protein